MTEKVAGNGRALERAVKLLLAQRQDFQSIRGLARAAGIQANTLTNWFAGKTSPQSAVLQKVAETLDVPVAALWDAYEGREPVVGVPDDLLGAIERAVERGVAAAIVRLREEGRL